MVFDTRIVGGLSLSAPSGVLSTREVVELAGFLQATMKDDWAIQEVNSGYLVTCIDGKLNFRSDIREQMRALQESQPLTLT